jgi:hypothetical protein
MSAEPEIATFLANSPRVSPILGTGSASRVYPLSIPQEAVLPAIAYTRVSNPTAARGQLRETLRNPTYQFDIRGLYDDVLALEEALVADMEYAKFGSVRQVHYSGAGPDEREPDTGIFTRRVELTIWR